MSGSPHAKRPAAPAKPPRPAASRRRTLGGVDPARQAALDVMCAVDDEDAYANLLLPELLRSRAVSGRDAAFATELTYSTLRMRGQIDAIIDSVSSRPVTDMDTRTRNALRLGACQLLHLRTAEHAAISTSVDLAAAHRPSSAGFVNAVLRAVQGRDLHAWLHELDAEGSDAASLALRFSHPRWMVAALGDALARAGRSAGELPHLLAADNTPAKPMLVARPGVCELSELQVDDGQQLGAWSRYAVTAPPGEPGALAAVRESRAAVQDEGSQIVALLAASTRIEGPDRHWLDACAGPGGKAALLAAVAASRGADLVALDRSAHRVELVERACRPFDNVVTRVCDAMALAHATWLPIGGFDRVLVDVPCTGLGALRRRPELRWRRRGDDLPGLVTVQEALLVSALCVTRPGGIVVYSTCSPHPRETDAVVDRARATALAAGVQTQLLDSRDIIRAGGVAVDPDALAQTQADGYLRLWPHIHGTDAMFAAVLLVAP